METRIETVSQTIAAGESYTTEPIEMATSQGLFGLQLAVSGDGTLKVEALLSNDGTTYRTKEGATEVLTGITKTSGPGSDGKLITDYDVGYSKFFKVKFTETGGANSVGMAASIAAR